MDLSFWLSTTITDSSAASWSFQFNSLFEGTQYDASLKVDKRFSSGSYAQSFLGSSICETVWGDNWENNSRSLRTNVQFQYTSVINRN